MTAKHCLYNGCRVAHLVACCIDDLLRLGLVHGERLLDQHALAALDHGQRSIPVRSVHHRHMHDVNLPWQKRSISLS